MSRPTSDKYVYVLPASGQPLMPTIRQEHVRRLLNADKARITVKQEEIKNVYFIGKMFCRS